jgi:hypothetical protein
MAVYDVGAIRAIFRHQERKDRVAICLYAALASRRMVSSNFLLNAGDKPFYVDRMTQSEAANELMRLAKQLGILSLTSPIKSPIKGS